MNAHASRSLVSTLDKRYRLLVPRIQHLPPAGSRPLTVSGRVAGWITPRATRALSSLEGVRIEPEAVCIDAVPTVPRRMLDQVLADAALLMRDAGCLRAWRDELLDVVGEGKTLGAIERAAVRPLGMLTKAVHLNAWTPDGRLWIALRSAGKSTDPGMWDTLVGGLAVAGETLEHSLLRESQEEAGLLPEHMAARSPLRTILRMHRRLPEGYQVEDVLVSECVLDESVPLRNQDGEVDEIRAVTVEEVWELIQAGQFTVEAELVVLEGLVRRLAAA
ncbi:MAG TPA: NUDIX domain-containing protein [Pusillimonas sp.]|uniref:NUDIX hydrolase n=1 Tax=Pusillimonas sp. TaxID=3040095 RepID=UPI002BEDF82B|nr:NUDIX domain-containing protein [Pusillimonas sp.]HUH87036.1 NUDIX domain-containing protein [Pusillimonas sp.]